MVGWDPGESKLSKVHCNTQLKRGGKKNHGHKHIRKLTRNENFTSIYQGILESIEREEAADLIQRFDGKVTQAVSKKTSYDVVRWDPGESKLSMVHCNSQLKRGGKKPWT